MEGSLREILSHNQNSLRPDTEPRRKSARKKTNLGRGPEEAPESDRRPIWQLKPKRHNHKKKERNSKINPKFSLQTKPHDQLLWKKGMRRSEEELRKRLIRLRGGALGKNEEIPLILIPFHRGLARIPALRRTEDTK